MSRQVNVRFAEDQFARVERCAAAEGRTVSDVVRDAAKEHLALRAGDSDPMGCLMAVRGLLRLGWLAADHVEDQSARANHPESARRASSAAAALRQAAERLDELERAVSLEKGFPGGEGH